MAKTSRPKQWAAAVAACQEALGELEDAKSKLEAALEDLTALQEEYQEWRDGLPENLDQSAVAEKLDAILDLDLESVLDEINIDLAREPIDAAESAELPLGFGRD